MGTRAASIGRLAKLKSATAAGPAYKTGPFAGQPTAKPVKASAKTAAIQDMKVMRSKQKMTRDLEKE